MIVAIIGTSTSLHIKECPEGYIEMQGERPSNNHVAQEGGIWVADYSKDAKLTRDAGVNSHISVHGAIWQVDPIGLMNMQDAIDETDHEGLPPETTINFRLADNTWRPTTSQDLKEVKSAYRKRKLAIFEVFEIWDDGPKDTPFVIE